MSLLSLLATTTPFPIPTKEIAPGVNMPVLMIGTGKSHNYEVVNIVKGWMALGGRGVDSAWNYLDQQAVASTIAAAGVKRSDVFLTSKIPGCPNASATKSYVQQDLQQLNTTWLDLMLIHYPEPSGCDATWQTLAELHDAGTLKAVGVSNFKVSDLKQLSGKTTPAVNQIHYSVYQHDEEAIKYNA